LPRSGQAFTSCVAGEGCRCSPPSLSTVPEATRMTRTPLHLARPLPTTAPVQPDSGYPLGLPRASALCVAGSPLAEAPESCVGFAESDDSRRDGCRGGNVHGRGGGFVGFSPSEAPNGLRGSPEAVASRVGWAKGEGAPAAWLWPDGERANRCYHRRYHRRRFAAGQGGRSGCPAGRALLPGTGP
jgi:hypothetical protein